MNIVYTGETLEDKAISFGNNRKSLRKKLNSAKNKLNLTDLFINPIFNFERKMLISSDGKLALKWQIRNKPNEPISYENQQTPIGVVVIVSLTETTEVGKK